MAAAAQRSVVMVASKRLGLLFVSGKNAGGLVVQVVLPQMSPLSGRPEPWAKQVRHMSMCSRTNVWVEHDALVRVQLRQQALRVCAPAARSRAPVRQNSLRSPVCPSERFRGLQNKLGPGSLTGLLDGLSLVLAIRREVCAHAREIVSQPARKHNARERCSQKVNEMMSRVGGIVFHVQGPKRCCAVAARCVAF